MGYIRHHAIIVTTYSRNWIEIAYSKAQEIFGERLSPIMKSPSNGYSTFAIPPDGSKEGWDESDVGDVRRKTFLDWLGTQGFEDGSSPYAWVEVQYGDDNGETIITRHSDEHMAGK